MHGAEHAGSGGAVLKQTVEKELGRLLRVACLGESALLRKGKALKPVEQLAAMAGNHIDLREVDMGVDETGYHQRAATVMHRDIRPEQRQERHGRAEPLDAAIADQQHAVTDMLDGRCVRAVDSRIAQAVQEVGADRDQRHQASAGAMAYPDPPEIAPIGSRRLISCAVQFRPCIERQSLRALRFEDWLILGKDRVLESAHGFIRRLEVGHGHPDPDPASLVGRWQNEQGDRFAKAFDRDLGGFGCLEAF